MLGPYRRLFALKGAAAFTISGLLARLALAISGVSTVVMVAALRDSYALAGAVAGAASATALVTVPLISRYVDRYGQAQIAVPAALWSGLMSVGLVLCLRFDAPVWAVFATAMASATAPNGGGMARARWAHLLEDDPGSLHVANSLEQVLDELVFIIGPILGVALSTALFPEAGRLVALVFTVGGTVLFGLQRSTQPPVQPVEQGRSGSPLGNRGLQVIMTVFLFTGAIFGSLEIATVAYTAAIDHRSLAGVILALQAVGSAIAGLLFGLVAPRGSVPSRFVTGVAGMAVCMLPLTLVGGIWPLAGLMFLAGMATAPTMINAMTLTQELIPRSQLNEGMTLTVTSLLGGISLGSVAGGWLVQRFAADSGYVLPASAAVLALATTGLGSRRLRQRVRGTVKS